MERKDLNTIGKQCTRGVCVCVCVFVCVCVCVCVCVTLSLSFSRLVDRALNRDRAINNSSAQLTSRIFDRQTALKKIFLDQIEAAGKQEMNVLRQWRRVIMENTHSR